MAKIREKTRHKAEKTGRRSCPKVSSSKTQPMNRPAVYPNRRSPSHSAKLKYSHA